MYHIVSEVVVRHRDGRYLLMLRDPNKPICPGEWEIGAGGCKLLRFHPYYSAKLAGVGRPDEAMGSEYVPGDDAMDLLNKVMLDAFGAAAP